jgi:hypothetical protein
MSVIRMTATPEPDGSLHLTVPVGAKNGTFDVAIVVTPKPEPASASTVAGWPESYFDRTYGSIADETFAAPPRLPPGPVEPLG